MLYVWSVIWWLLRGLLIGDEHFDLVEGFLGAGGSRGGGRGGLGVGRACMRAGDVDLFTSIAWRFGGREVRNEDYSFTGQHCQGGTGKNGNLGKITMVVRHMRMECKNQRVCGKSVSCAGVHISFSVQY